MRRYISIDVLRGIAIVLMVLTHFADNLSPREESSARLYDLVSVLGGVPAPLFTFLAGVSFSLWAGRQRANGHKPAAISRAALRRGAFLFTAGIAFNVCVWLPADILNWDVLTLLGVALAVLAVARQLPPAVLTTAVVLILLISPPLRVVADYGAYWEDDTFTYDFTARDAAAGFFVVGYFPLFPWLAFPLVGFVVGEIYFRPRSRLLAPPWTLPAVGVGFLTLAVSAAVARPYLPGPVAQLYAADYTEFPASTAYVLGNLGLDLLALAALHSRYDRADRTAEPGAVARTLSRFSVFSLTVYFAHHVAHLWPLWLYGAWASEDATHFWREAMPTPTAVGLGVAFLAACDPALRWLERRKRYSVEAVMRRVSDKPAKPPARRTERAAEYEDRSRSLAGALK